MGSIFKRGLKFFAILASFVLFVIDALPLKIIVRSHSGTFRHCYGHLKDSIEVMSKPQNLISRIDDALSQDLKLCLITRGVPGRGKTTIAEQIVQHYGSNGEYNAIMVAADDFMVDSNGDYCFMPENLSAAHQSCRSRLVMAMEEGVEVVCQHNTNVCKWESEDLLIKAVALGYLVVYIEPTYAWARKADIPSNFRNVLVNSHGVPEDKIEMMISRKETFLPRYLAYWFKTSALIKSFAESGVAEKDLFRILQQFTAPKGNDEQKKYTGTAGGSSGVEAKISADDGNEMLPVDTTDSNDVLWNKFLSPLLHVTTDYIGTDTRLLSEKNHKDLLDDVLASSTMQIIAIYSDDRGVGALVTHVDQSDDETARTAGIDKSEMKGHDKITASGWIDVNIKRRHDVQRYEQYTGAMKARQQQRSGANPTLPHITLMVQPTKNAIQLGQAVYEFRQLLLTNKCIVMDNQGGSDTTDTNIFYPNIVTVGGFEAVLFEKPVRFNGTYAYSYGLTTFPAKKVYVSSKHQGQGQGQQRRYPNKKN